MKQKITLSVHLMLELLTSCLAALSSDHLLEEASTLGGCGERNAGEGCLIRPAEVAESMINNVFSSNQWGKYKTWVPWNTQKGPLSYPSPSSLFSYRPLHFHGFPGGSDGKESACNVRSLGSIPGSGRSHGKENGYPLQYSRLENPMAEELGGLQPMGSQRVRHDWVTNT